MNISEPVYDAGDKYMQAHDKFSPSNTIVKSPGRAVRMEDYAVVYSLPSQEGYVVVLADGHGAVPMVVNHKKVPTRLVGGYESARLASQAIAAYTLKVAEQLPLHHITDEGVDLLLQDAFGFAQKLLRQETEKGALNHPDTQRLSLAERRQLLRSSKMDGYHFVDAPADALVTDKFMLPYSGGYVTMYTNTDGTTVQPAEYGTTVTALLILPTTDTEYQLFVANAGDSDAYLFRRTSDSQYVPEKLSADHTVNNPHEVERMAAYRMKVNGEYFGLGEGKFAGHALMPSRSLGHSLLAHHGITHRPSVSNTTAQKGDYLIVASDGLWSVLGSALRLENPKQKGSSDELAAQYVAEYLRQNAGISPVNLAQGLRSVTAATRIPHDNLVIVAAKL